MEMCTSMVPSLAVTCRMSDLPVGHLYRSRHLTVQPYGNEPQQQKCATWEYGGLCSEVYRFFRSNRTQMWLPPNRRSFKKMNNIIALVFLSCLFLEVESAACTDCQGQGMCMTNGKCICYSS